ncbi:hypothetical protein Enr10x_03780 [Gimesia panareensis]|uniref:Uncharacterized protein n=2 Tax=Gimesia panareensis TaxID=2527978 RepID=A0A517Q0D7_9PLAN|nr:hypothetical protein Enr10x_03780 [Gimesia panareensis]
MTSSDKSSQPREKIFTLGNTIVMLLFLGVIYFLFFHGFVFANAANSQLLAIYEVAEVGGTLHELDEKVASLPQTWITASSHEDSRIFSAPLQFGASEWILSIKAEEGLITCVRIHTADSIRFHPEAAPPDKGECSFEW